VARWSLLILGSLKKSKENTEPQDFANNSDPQQVFTFAFSTIVSI